MQTSALSSAASSAAANAAASASTAKKSVINSDFNTFLVMLTTQIKNQDPTNPMESADFAVQLATFSGVEQQVKTNEMLGNLSSQFGVMGMSQLAAWVGQEARAPSPVYLGTSDVTLTYASAAGADRAVLSVRDASGTLVGREDVPLGTGPFQWSGHDIEGNPLPNATYSLSLESFQGDRSLGAPSVVEAYSPIQEARSGANGTVLVLQGGIEVAATAITALRVAGSQNTTTANNVSQTNTDVNTGANTASTQSSVAEDAIFSQDPPVTLDQNSQPEPETYTPD